MESCRCPITGEFFEDPVVGDDGHTYERKAITEWLSKNATSPLTREPMNITSLRTNHTVKQMIEELRTTKETSLQTQYQFQLDVDIRKTKSRPIFQSFGKFIYEVAWINRDGPPIILMKIDGAKAKREASFYVQLSCHPHIVRTFGLVQSNPNCVMLLQEAAPHGDLCEMLRENGFKPNETVLWEIFKQICDAMICLADNGIVHGDLACRNVLVFQSHFSEPKQNLVKLTDFGLTLASTVYAVVGSPVMTTMTIIPIRYAAPEILQNPTQLNYTEKADVYSMGVLMWEACSNGELPYSVIDDEEEVRERKLNDERLSQPTSCSHQLWEIMNRCWQQDPLNRPTFKMLRDSMMNLETRPPFNQEQISAPFSETDQSVAIENQSAENTAYIPCEFCDNLVDISSWSAHIEDCRVRENQRLEDRRHEIASTRITAQIPCELCGELVSAEQLEQHQTSCSVHKEHNVSMIQQSSLEVPQNATRRHEPYQSTQRSPSQLHASGNSSNVARNIFTTKSRPAANYPEPPQLYVRSNSSNAIRNIFTTNSRPAANYPESPQLSVRSNSSNATRNIFTTNSRPAANYPEPPQLYVRSNRSNATRNMFTMNSRPAANYPEPPQLYVRSNRSNATRNMFTMNSRSAANYPEPPQVYVRSNSSNATRNMFTMNSRSAPNYLEPPQVYVRSNSSNATRNIFTMNSRSAVNYTKPPQ